MAFGGNNQAGPIDVATARNASASASGRMDFESETFLVQPQPYTLAIRGRGDTHNLEYRQDGTANALLTPNGGRGGIGVGAVAQPIGFNARQDPDHWQGRTGPLDTDGGTQAVAWGITDDETVMKDCLPTMATPSASGGGHPPAVATAMQVRRLTPVECERLQGFPDGYTAIPWRNKPADQCPDGPRYKALGNSWAVPVVRWIGWRIESAANKLRLAA
jgi:DNA (cytosine-5)-methyltransferase 1